PTAFALDETGKRWWRVQISDDTTTAIGWAGEVGHTGITLHSPHEWVDFKLVESKPTGEGYGNIFTTAAQMAAFQGGELALTDAQLDGPMREVFASLDTIPDHRLTLGELRAAQRSRGKLGELSRLIIRYPSEWKADPASWDAWDKNVPPTARAAWQSEKARIAKLVWWDAVAGKVEGFPVDSFVFHVHPVALAANFNVLEYEEFLYLAMTLYGEARGQNYTSKVAVAWIIRNRLEAGRWGDTYKSVVTAEYQFTCWNEKIDPDNYKAIHSPTGDAWKDCRKAAMQVMTAPDSDNIFPGATNYYSPRSQAALHEVKPSVYPSVPPFAVQEKRIPNPPGVSDEDYRFYRP
ncbi:cell wall hydrolase, partial [Cupriavidus sp. 2KB_15]